MLNILRAEDGLLCLGGSSTCAAWVAWATIMPDGNFVVLSKTTAYVKSKTANTIASDLHIVFGSQMRMNGVEGKVYILGLIELVLFG